jgi:hypothetical protein
MFKCHLLSFFLKPNFKHPSQQKKKKNFNPNLIIDPKIANLLTLDEIIEAKTKKTELKP